MFIYMLLLPRTSVITSTLRSQVMNGQINKYSIENFYNITGVPILLNTSFNENEPIVSNPAEAPDCFLRTKMDMLVLENYIISRK